jgi:hypothetical protein
MSSRLALESTKPPVQWVPGALSPGVKRTGREADHSPPTSDEVKKMWIYTSTPPYAFMAQCLIKHRDKFTFILLLKNLIFVCYIFKKIQHKIHYNISITDWLHHKSDCICIKEIWILPNSQMQNHKEYISKFCVGWHHCLPLFAWCGGGRHAIMVQRADVPSSEHRHVLQSFLKDFPGSHTWPGISETVN